MTNENLATRFPRQIKYIIGNEAAERFSYYGMRSILVIFMTRHLLMPDHEAKSIFHAFVSANYFMPLIGGFIADRYWGKYRTIISLSMVYCLGHLVLALFDGIAGIYLGLFLIAVGSGGIKPCVSAHVGDQFGPKNQHLLGKVFDIFYFSINFGAFFSTLLIPWILPKYGSSWAFGIPGILMLLATYVFWLGRHYYVFVPPTGKENSSRFLSVVWHGLTHRGDRKPGESLLDIALAKFGRERVEGAKAVIDVFKVLITVAAFWALYDQTSSSWVLQAEKMNLTVLGITYEASQIQAVNPILIMVFIPLFSMIIYPAIEKMGIKCTPLRKMATGMVLTALSFVIAGILQMFVDSGQAISVAWQLIPYVIITAAEILISITGLEFAYTQAPRAMKSTIMSLWLLTVAVGNWLTAVVSMLNKFQGSSEYFFYSILMLVVAVIFIGAAMRYQERNYIEPAVAM